MFSLEPKNYPKNGHFSINRRFTPFNVAGATCRRWGKMILSSKYVYNQIFAPIGQSSDTQTEKSWIETKLKYDFKLHVWQKFKFWNPARPTRPQYELSSIFRWPEKKLRPPGPRGREAVFAGAILTHRTILPICCLFFDNHFRLVTIFPPTESGAVIGWKMICKKRATNFSGGIAEASRLDEIILSPRVRCSSCTSRGRRGLMKLS